MERFICAAEYYPCQRLFSNIVYNWQKKVYLLLAICFLLLFFSLPASAAVEGILAKADDGSYHQYCYNELIDSYASFLMGKPDGLYEDFAGKEKVALLDSVNGYVDYSYILDQYAKTLLDGRKFNITEITECKNALRAEIPAKIKLVSAVYGQLVSLEKSLISQDAGETGSDLSGSSKEENKSSSDLEQQQADKTVSTASKTPIVGESTISLSRAQAWAKNKNAHQRFIDIAQLYWEYGDMTGIRPEVLYAKAAYESGYGRFTGHVPASYNNWAGIKVGGSNGDKPEDHQKFATPEEGVRGHFNHISAYVGLKPIGEPHDRYYSIKSIGWAGTVNYVEELSGKWAPSSTYHETIVRMLGEMK